MALLSCPILEARGLGLISGSHQGCDLGRLIWAESNSWRGTQPLGERGDLDPSVYHSQAVWRGENIPRKTGNHLRSPISLHNTAAEIFFPTNIANIAFSKLRMWVPISCQKEGSGGVESALSRETGDLSVNFSSIIY